MNCLPNAKSSMAATDRSDEVAINQRLRRADWRFLLPDPRPARSICFADGLLAQAVDAISDRVIEPTTHSIGDCDLAVARNPAQSTLQATWAALRPGGACYVEWTSPLTGGPAKIRQRLETIGFTASGLLLAVAAARSRFNALLAADRVAVHCPIFTGESSAWSCAD